MSRRSGAVSVCGTGAVSSSAIVESEASSTFASAPTPFTSSSSTFACTAGSTVVSGMTVVFAPMVSVDGGLEISVPTSTQSNCALTEAAALFQALTPISPSTSFVRTTE